MTAPPDAARCLVFAWGNPSRGDDALGLLCMDRLRTGLSAAHIPPAAVEFLEAYQLQVECALDLVGRRDVLFIDASVDCHAPFQAMPLHAARDASFTSHAMSPQALLQVYVDLQRQAPPPCTLLAIRGECFDLGATPGANSLAHLDAAARWASQWLASRCVADAAPMMEPR